jgi:MFS family permease
MSQAVHTSDFATSIQQEELPILRLTPVQRLICAVACLGFAFDLYESLMLPLIVRPAITSLSGLKPGTSSFNLWVGLLFYIPSALGGIFGLVGGYLADWMGRRRVLVGSILCSMASQLALRLFRTPSARFFSFDV